MRRAMQVKVTRIDEENGWSVLELHSWPQEGAYVTLRVEHVVYWDPERHEVLIHATPCSGTRVVFTQ